MDQAIQLLAKEGTAKLIEFNPLRATDVTLPKGATVLINVHAINADPDLFPNPTQFNPERFLDSEGNAVRSKLNSVVTFFR